MNACDTCAFGGNGAAKEPYNRLKSDICAFGAIPFFCHHGKDGTEYDWQESPLGPMLLEPANRKVCAGWQAKVKELKRCHYFSNKDYLIIRRIVATAAMKALEIFTAKDVNLHKKEQARVRLAECVKFITRKDIGDLEIPL